MFKSNWAECGAEELSRVLSRYSRHTSSISHLIKVSSCPPGPGSSRWPGLYCPLSSVLSTPAPGNNCPINRFISCASYCQDTPHLFLCPYKSWQFLQQLCQEKNISVSPCWCSHPVSNRACNKGCPKVPEDITIMEAPSSAFSLLKPLTPLLLALSHLRHY